MMSLLLSDFPRSGFGDTWQMPPCIFQHAGFDVLKINTFEKYRKCLVYRSALKTVTRWRSWIPQFKEAAERHLPLEPVGRDTLSVPCWDSPPVAANLWEATRRLPNNSTWAQGRREYIYIYIYIHI